MTVNVPHLKQQMRKYAEQHGLTIPRVAWQSTVWGLGARTLAWRVSGHYGRPTTDKRRLWAHFNPPTFGERVVAVALREVGVKESPAGSNTGPRVSVYQDVTGAHFQPWCASFACWVLKTAARLAGKPCPKFPPLPAYVPSWTTMIRNRVGTWRPVAFGDARGGDVVTLWGSGHIEIVRGREGDYLLCIGGNTSPIGRNANGGMVAKTKRHRSEVTIIGRAS